MSSPTSLTLSGSYKTDMPVISSRFTLLEDFLSLLLERQEAAFERVEARFDAIEARLDAMDDRFDAIDARLDTMQVEITETKNVVQKVSHRLEKIEIAMPFIISNLELQQAALTSLLKQYGIIIPQK